MKKELTTKVNGYLANVGVEYVKLHNLHWNVIGKQFKSVHEYLETLYDGFADQLDSVAELLKMNGEYPLASLKDYLANATIKELPSKDVTVEESLKIVLADMETLRSEALEIRSLASDEDLFSVSNAMEDVIEEYNKTIWFINSMLK